eukprot:TRINITY_DN66280_c0_g1_i4.p1 TRINITY_DN66280_c0_g1~~TRINITY_DN66280_c0_g1_i4.p1  ORF type:complete len:125 (-),score=20.51 TRINITY_DN66280_c0_g1_i4:10-354(-)
MLNCTDGTRSPNCTISSCYGGYHLVDVNDPENGCQACPVGTYRVQSDSDLVDCRVCTNAPNETCIYYTSDAWPTASCPFDCNEPASGDDSHLIEEIGRAVQQECRDRSRMPSSA